MTEMLGLFDGYSRRARLYPALITLLPAIVLVVALFPGLLSQGISGPIVGLIVACGALYLLADVSRTMGKQLEPKLLLKWGGWPTTIWLRHADEHLDDSTTRRYHAFLSARVAGLKLPTLTEEANDPIAADKAYISAVQWLKEQCRGKPFVLVETENASYGFRRNMLGLKPVALAVTVICVVALIVAVATSAGRDPILLGALILDLVVVVLWLSVVNEKWVEAAGHQYARALLSGCDKIGQNSSQA